MNSQNRPVALVTGASSGIGEATATLLTQVGYDVFGTSRRGADDGGTPGFHVLKLDVTQQESVQSTVGEVIQRVGHIDLLVNNAGFGVMGGPKRAQRRNGRPFLRRMCSAPSDGQGGTPTHAPTGIWTHHQCQFYLRQSAVSVCSSPLSSATSAPVIGGRELADFASSAPGHRALHWVPGRRNPSPPTIEGGSSSPEPATATASSILRILSSVAFAGRKMWRCLAVS